MALLAMRAVLRPWRTGLFGTLTVLLAAQELPPLPETRAITAIPDFAELLPYRPMGTAAPISASVPLRYRGEQVTNGAEGWIIERGALQSEDMLLLADHIQYDPGTGMLVADGNIRLEGQGIRLRCERLKMDWKNRSGEAWALELEISPDWTLHSDQVAFASLQQWDFRPRRNLGGP
jgi:lipopolysaccharide assembly outer membrane protein LptD (OstA)